MKKIIFILLLSACVLSCAKTQSLGAGVSVDTQGNLKIDAPLYVIDKSAEKPELKRAPASMNLSVNASISSHGEADIPLEVTGGIVKGRFSLTIKKPDENWLIGSNHYWGITDDLYTSGADVRIGELHLQAVTPDDYHPIDLFDNPQVLSVDIDVYLVYGDQYKHFYSLGDINISSKLFPPQEMSDWTVDDKFDIRFTPGWNVIRLGSYFDDTLKDYVYFKTSVLPKSNAVWVLFD